MKNILARAKDTIQKTVSEKLDTLDGNMHGVVSKVKDSVLQTLSEKDTIHEAVDDLLAKIDSETTTECIRKYLSIPDDDLEKEIAHEIMELEKVFTVLSPDSVFGRRLSAMTEKYVHIDGYSFTYRIYRDDDSQAMCFPDGTIYISSRMFASYPDEEILFVIGHEIGHIVHGDSRKRYIRTKVIEELLSMQNTLVIRHLFFDDFSRESLAKYYIYKRYIEQYLILPPHFLECFVNRRNELLADRYGFRLLQQAGFPPEAAVHALQKLGTEECNGRIGFYSALFSSYPKTEDRWKALERELEQQTQEDVQS